MVHLFGIQDDILDEKSGQLSFANSGPCCVATVGYILTDPEGVATPAHSRDLDFRVVLGCHYANTPPAAKSQVTAILDGATIRIAPPNAILRTGDGDR
jgi:hypothetical protein